MQARDFTFGDFRFDPATRQLWRRGERVVLGGRATDLLHLLLAHRGEVVGNRELIEAA